MGIFGNKKEQTEFRGVSASNEKRNAIVLFAAEAAVVLVFIVGVVFTLNYFNIFPLSKISSALFNWLPTVQFNNGIDTTAKNQPTQVPKALDADLYAVDKTVVPIVEVVSDTLDISIKVTDNKALAQFTNKYTIFGRKYYLGEGKYSEILKKLIIHLTDKEQPNNKYFLLGKVPVSSTGIQFDGNTLNLYVFLSDEAYTNKSSTPEIFFEQSILTATFRMSYNPIGGKMNPDKENELIKLVQQVNENSTRYVTITKNTKEENE